MLTSSPFDGAVTWIISEESERVYCSSVGGVAVSVDLGESWSVLGDLRDVFTLCLGGVEGGVPALLAGTPSGIHRWNPRDESWKHVLGGVEINALACPDAGDRSTVLAATEHAGIVRSGDGGDTWEYACAGLLDDTVLCLAASQHYSTDRNVFAGTVNGLYESKNGGKSWLAVELPDDVTVTSLSVVSNGSGCGCIAVGTEEHGLLLVNDRERSWRHIPEFGSSSVSALLGSPGDSRHVVAAVDSDIWVSQDSGATWTLSETTADLVMCFAAVADAVLLAGTASGHILRSNDWGKSWRPVPSGG